MATFRRAIRKINSKLRGMTTDVDMPSVSRVIYVITVKSRSSFNLLVINSYEQF